MSVLFGETFSDDPGTDNPRYRVIYTRQVSFPR